MEKVNRRDILSTIGKIGGVAAGAGAAAEAARRIMAGNEAAQKRDYEERRGTPAGLATPTPYNMPEGDNRASRALEINKPDGSSGSSGDEDAKSTETKAFAKNKLMRSLGNPFPFAVYPHEQSGRKY